ncbi:hypothetical protein BDN70DRAFT_901885 [Pholiota conissans]|uniref:Uncharacterized protein n=1 Tax=Pholiota conissans TaxID=109636 RepID=A0A9P6CR14_9AGAR|nr:hypothetical protein BDN70DRAFT_901885 [Pholiota conissans]
MWKVEREGNGKGSGRARHEDGRWMGWMDGWTDGWMDGVRLTKVRWDECEERDEGRFWQDVMGPVRSLRISSMSNDISPVLILYAPSSFKTTLGFVTRRPGRARETSPITAPAVGVVRLLVSETSVGTPVGCYFQAKARLLNQCGIHKQEIRNALGLKTYHAKDVYSGERIVLWARIPKYRCPFLYSSLLRTSQSPLFSSPTRQRHRMNNQFVYYAEESDAIIDDATANRDQIKKKRRTQLTNPYRESDRNVDVSNQDKIGLVEGCKLYSYARCTRRCITEKMNACGLEVNVVLVVDALVSISDVVARRTLLLETRTDGRVLSARRLEHVYIVNVRVLGVVVGARSWILMSWISEPRSARRSQGQTESEDSEGAGNERARRHHRREWRERVDGGEPWQGQGVRWGKQRGKGASARTVDSTARRIKADWTDGRMDGWMECD